MSIVDLKGQLLTRAANAEAAMQRAMNDTLLAEEHLRQCRATYAGASAVHAELRHLVTLLDQPVSKTP